MLSIIENLKTWKIILENSWKNGAPFGRQSRITGTPWQVYLHVGT